MKRGIKFTPMDNPAIEASTFHGVMEIMGYPVTFDENGPMAVSRGVWPFKSIAVGPAWLTLTPREQRAVLLHEVHHCRAWHMEQRLLLALVCWLPPVKRLARQHELDADAFAVREGYGIDLFNLVARLGGIASEPFYPSVKERLAHLQGCIARAQQ